MANKKDTAPKTTPSVPPTPINPLQVKRAESLRRGQELVKQIQDKLEVVRNQDHRMDSDGSYRRLAPATIAKYEEDCISQYSIKSKVPDDTLLRDLLLAKSYNRVSDEVRNAILSGQLHLTEKVLKKLSRIRNDDEFDAAFLALLNEQI